MTLPAINNFRTEPVDDEGVAVLVPVHFYVMDADAPRAVTIEMTIKTDELISKMDVRQAELQIEGSDAAFSDILEFGIDDLSNSHGPLVTKRNGQVAEAQGDFIDRCRCVPPIDLSPPCKDPQSTFTLTHCGTDAKVAGRSFTVTGLLRGTKEAYPVNKVISGSLVLIFE